MFELESHPTFGLVRFAVCFVNRTYVVALVSNMVKIVGIPWRRRESSIMAQYHDVTGRVGGSRLEPLFDAPLRP